MRTQSNFQGQKTLTQTSIQIVPSSGARGNEYIGPRNSEPFRLAKIYNIVLPTIPIRDHILLDKALVCQSVVYKWLKQRFSTSRLQMAHTNHDENRKGVRWFYCASHITVQHLTFLLSIYFSAPQAP